ncbi:sacsin [Lingula anatina]|uniref:Sacsin n=1 Tax=Lingula anatina TaxID=7574 RepID=A0A1S3JLZ3_LINAN|nr:sacsin [Lingula anatina]|eukprot:XP_013411141.1 sacsin [Lingula anatina]
MADEVESDDDFDVILPSLIKQFQNILRRYPDNGQILKEIIQNAEDAGATVVKFLYDDCCHLVDGDDTGGFSHPGLKEFQGPSLFAYNDAVFTKEDWKGICMIDDSIKEEDALKVGRFGLGFKSVFHITDLPCVLSKQYIAMIDPYREYFQPKAAEKWRLKDIAGFHQQYKPFLGVFDCSAETFQGNSYNGTMFRFPLRNAGHVQHHHAQPISSNVYDGDSIKELFEAFQEEALLVLLFLRSVERIEMYRRDHKETKLLFAVEISNIEDVKNKRQQFNSKLPDYLKSLRDSNKELIPLRETYPIILKAENHQNKQKNEQTYLVTSFCSGTIKSQEFVKKPDCVKNIPLVGIAMPLMLNNPQEGVLVSDSDHKTNDENLTAREDSPNCPDPVGRFHSQAISPCALPHGNAPSVEKKTSGHVFCSLPLPLADSRGTGLPVHVNGFFELTPERSDLQWPTTDDKHTQDKSKAWNHHLLVDVLPCAYKELLFQATKDQGIPISPGQVISCFPDEEKVDEKWKKIMPKVYAHLFQCNMFYTKAYGGKWISLDVALIVNFLDNSALCEAVYEIMLLTGHCPLKLPPCVLDAIQDFHPEKDRLNFVSKDVNHKLVKDCLASHDGYCKFPPNQKFELLRYLLDNLPVVKLHGLKLLPLADGTFTTFSSKQGSQPVYIAANDMIQLFAGLEKRFLHSSDEIIKEKLIQSVKQGRSETQLCMLDEEGFSQLLPEAVQAKKLKNNTGLDPQNRAWLDKVWGYLCQNFQDLQRFEGLPILPVHLNDGRDVQLHLPARSSSISIQLVQHQGKSICLNIKKLLQTLDVFLAVSVLDKAGNHQAIFDNRVALPSPDGVLQSLSRQYQYKGNEVITAFNKLDASVRKAFRKFISQSGDIGCHKDVMRKFEIFPIIEIGSQCNSAEFDEKAKMDEKLLALDDAKDAVKLKYLPQVSLPWAIIDVTLPECEHLVKVLGQCVIHTQVSIFSTHILPELKKGGVFAERYMKDISLFMLQHYELINEKEIAEQVQHLHCIPIKNGFALPSKICNPQSRTLQELFKDQDVFPLNPFTEGTIIPQLVKVGMKNEDDVTADDILTAVKDVETRAATTADPTSCEVLKRKSQAIASFLGKRPELLQQFPSSIPNHRCHLKGLLLDLHWLPMCCEPPQNIPYPRRLPWWRDTCLFQKPSSLKKMNKVSTYLIGSVQPLWEGIPGEEEAEASIVEHFNMDSLPDVRSVVQQLAVLQQNYNEEEKTLFELMVKEIYHFLEQHAEAALAEVDKQALSQWIWHGNGFASQDQVLCSDSALDLRPYMYTVPDFFAKDHLKFKSLTSFEPYLDVLMQMKQKYDGFQQFPLGILSNSKSSDLKLSVEILNQLSKFAKDGDINPDEVCVPMPLRSRGQLRFEFSNKCVFLDAEHMDKDVTIQLKKENVHVLHRDIPIATAYNLRVPPLLRYLLKPEDLPFEEFGQGQSLCSIISNILEGYQDGFAFIKEMIQNADDAGATEVRFLYDARQNKNYRKSLIDEGMAECQGQALWVYNDAVFEPVDFKRIIKVGGGMKKEDAATIGRFGKGFNIVYNITDTPSFISQNNFVIFDPNAHHLGRAIKDKSKPGVKIDLDKTRNREMIADQLAPFENIFHCQINNRFNGTLFRLPLRTKKQSQKTELKPGKPYIKKNVLDLFRLTIERSESLLLFIQNVVKFSLWYLPTNAKDPSDAVEIFIIEKHIPKRCIKPVVNYKTTLPKPAKKLDKEKRQLIQATRILHAASNAVQKKDHTELKCTCRFHITCRTLPPGGKLLKMVPKDETREYFLTSYMSTGEAFNLAVEGKIQGTLPVASIALPVQSHGNKLEPLPLDLNKGALFCQLPLPISTNLPVHVSGTFLTTSCRNHLVQRSADDRQNVMAEWNEALLRETLPKAYIFFLEKCKENCSIGRDFHILWPVEVEKIPKYFCIHFVQTFHRKLMELNGPKLLTDGHCWGNFHEIVYLDPSFQDKVGIGQVAYNILSWWVKKQPGNKIAVQLPMKIVEEFRSHGLDFSNEYSRHRFYKEVFFANIAEMQAFAEWRDTLMLKDVLPSVTNDEEMASLVRTQKCIPVMPSGNVLELPGKLVCQEGSQSILYTEEDEVFPFQQYKEQTYHLQKLGMRYKVEDITWAEVCHCAKRTLSISERTTRIARILNILKFIGLKRTGNIDVDDREKCEVQELKSVPFLPILQTSSEYPLPLFDLKEKKSTQDILYEAPQKMGLLKDIDLVGSAMPIVDETLITSSACTRGHIPQETFQFIGCVTNHGIETIRVQMMAAINYWLKGIHPDKLSGAQRLMWNVYSYLQELCKQEQKQQDISSAFKGLPVVLVDDHFVQPRDVVFSLKNSCEPYLFALPNQYKTQFEQLFKCLGVRRHFDAVDYIVALRKLSETKVTGEENTTSVIKKAEAAANMLVEQLKEESKDLQILGDIVLPDIHGKFRKANQLTMWSPHLPQRKVLFLHPDIRIHGYEYLGIKQPHEGILSEYSSSIPFGQQVQLETSITRILKGYSPEDLFKEVLQNADDARATEVHFVLDQRTHKSECVPGKNWGKMQGPALCIFNNAPFTDSDLTAIATLGSDHCEMENKSRNPYKTGQFGIGFNSVYNITDTPWIVTRGSSFEVLQDRQGKYEDICCVFDPLRKYVPGATTGSPGQLFNLKELAEDYPDVKSCLLEEQFDLQGKTLFRLPLRNPPQDASCTDQDLPAWKSLDIRKVKDLLETFKAQMPQMLLFLKHIRKIHVSEIHSSTVRIHKNKVLKNTFSSTSEVTRKFLQ